MSVNSNATYMIQRDSIPVIKGQNWYKLSHKPIMDSLNVRFDLSNGITETRFMDFSYNYDNIENDCIMFKTDFTVYNVINDGFDSYTDNGITYIPYTSQESLIFGKYLVGTTYQKFGNIIRISYDNYTEHLDQLVGMTFIDFSISNQIKQIISNESDSESVCEQVDISYFFEVIE